MLWPSGVVIEMLEIAHIIQTTLQPVASHHHGSRLGIHVITHMIVRGRVAACVVVTFGRVAIPTTVVTMRWILVLSNTAHAIVLGADHEPQILFW